MTWDTEKSGRLFERAQRVLVEGANSPSRGGCFYEPHPVFIDRGRGGRIWDVDGNEYLDLMLGFSALILGHAHPEIAQAITRAAELGTHYAAGSEIEVEVAERLCELIPCAEMVRLANSGTEATMAALRLARGFTGRRKFIKFEGQYHGWYDDFMVNCHARPLDALGTRRDPVAIPDSSGLPPEALANTVLVPWNDLEGLEDKMRQHRGQLAAVITEPIMSNIGCIPPRPGYLEGLRRLCSDQDVLLIFDEVVTGFRYAPGGYQEFCGVTPDLATFGKAMGAGLPIGAIAGRREIMETLAWGGVLHYGTFNANRLALEVIRANLEILTRNSNAALKHLAAVGDRIIAGLREAVQRRRVAAVVQGFGPMFQIYFTAREGIFDYRDYCAWADTARYGRFAQELLRRGVYVTTSNGLHSIICVAHTEEDADQFLEAADAALAAL